MHRFVHEIIMHCGLGLAKKSGVLHNYGSYVLGLGCIIIQAFYFSDPFPMFLVRDHFSCKYAPRKRPRVASPAVS